MELLNCALKLGREQATHLRERRPSSERRSDFMTNPEPETDPESNDDEVDPFAELGVPETSSAANISDGLEAFMDDEDEEEPVDSAPVMVEHDEGDDNDDDMFAALGVAGPSVALASSGDDDILSAFMDDDDDDEEVDEEASEPTPEISTTPNIDGIEAYKMVLETVWVDGILDPGEVHLLAKRRENLGISFEEHLALVREMLG